MNRIEISEESKEYNKRLLTKRRRQKCSIRLK